MSRRVLEGRAVESKGKNNIQRVGKKKNRLISLIKSILTLS